SSNVCSSDLKIYPYNLFRIYYMDRFFDNLQHVNLNLLEDIINIVVDNENNDWKVSNNDYLKENNSNDPIYGCKHYLRRCKIKACCCDKIFPCRLCHDEENFDFQTNIQVKHKINRFNIKEIICTNCNETQSVKQFCEKCNCCFGLYFCKICNLFDDIDKKQFHCYDCGFCRIDGKDNFIHCNKCKI